MSLLGNISTLESATLWDFSVYWQDLFQIMLICALLLLAHMVRRKIPVLRRYLIPTAIIAGFFGLGLKYLFNSVGAEIQGKALIDNDFLNTITYHTLAIGFISIGFVTSKNKREKDGSAIKGGLLISSSYALQGAVGLLVSLGIGLLFSKIGNGDFTLAKAPYAGIILPLAFGQGPGQAGNFGQTYQSLGTTEFAQYALAGGRDFGLALAALGTLAAVIPGTVFLNLLAKQGKIKRELDAETKVIAEAANPVEVEGEIASTESTDKLAVQLSIVGITYLVTYLVMFGLTSLFVDVLGIQFLQPLLWGFNFLFALLVTVLVKAIYNKLRAKRVIKRGYINNYMMSRISGTAFDFMIVTSIMSIEIANISEPSILTLLIVLTIVGTILTTVYVYIISKRHFKSRFVQTFLVFYGNLTGTASNGLALLREIDPELQSGASDDLIEGSTFAILFGAPILFILGIVYQGALGWYLSLGLLTVYFVLSYIGLVWFSKRKEKKIKENPIID